MKRYLFVVCSLLIALYAVPSRSSVQAPPQGLPLQQLQDIQGRHEAVVLAQPGVIGIGIGTRGGQSVFEVLVDEDAAMPPLPVDLEGVPVVTRRISKIIPHDGGTGCPLRDPFTGGPACHSAQEPLPTPMGQSTSTANLCFACTLGFKACNPDTFLRGYVTNNHCNTDASGCENSPVGLTHVERSTLDNGCSLTGLAQIGTTAQVVPLLPFPTGNLVDAAFIESFYESSGEIKDIGSPTSASSVAVDECIRKSGRTTGLTFGRVRVVNLTVDVGPYECSAKYRFNDQIMYEADTTCGVCTHPPCPMTLPGDSGAAVFKASTRSLVALNFAGTSDGQKGVGNGIGHVLQAFGGLTLDWAMCDTNGSGGE